MAVVGSLAALWRPAVERFHCSAKNLNQITDQSNNYVTSLQTHNKQPATLFCCPTSWPSECARDTARALGFATLKSEQEKAVAQFASGREVFVVLTTGYGKSLCYYCPFLRF